MNLTEIFNSGTNVTLAISANDLREWHKEVIRLSDTCEGWRKTEVQNVGSKIIN